MSWFILSFSSHLQRKANCVSLGSDMRKRKSKTESFHEKLEIRRFQRHPTWWDCIFHTQMTSVTKSAPLWCFEVSNINGQIKVLRFCLQAILHVYRPIKKSVMRSWILWGENDFSWHKRKKIERIRIQSKFYTVSFMFCVLRAPNLNVHLVHFLPYCVEPWKPQSIY